MLSDMLTLCGVALGFGLWSLDFGWCSSDRFTWSCDCVLWSRDEMTLSDCAVYNY